MQENLSAFLAAGWRYIDPAEFVQGWHLEAIAEHLQAVTQGEIRRLVINVPPRTSKSSMVSVAWPAWTWAQTEIAPLSGPQVQFLFASYAQTLSFRDSVKTRRLLESPWYQDRWGGRFQLVGDQNTKQRFENTTGGYRLATSVDGALTGEGAQVIVVDDPHNTREIESDLIRQSVLDWWDEALSTRLNDPKTGAYVVIMQRLYEDDLTGHILEREAHNWTHLNLPMRYDPARHCTTGIGFSDPRTYDGELLWPERFGEREVYDLEQRLGPFAASGQLQQAPAPRGGGIFKSAWWNLWPEEGEKFDQLGKPVKPLAYPEMSFILASVDTAMATKEENDWSALTIWGIWHDKREMPKIMLMEAWHVRLEFRPLVEKIIGACRKRKVDKLLIEAKANGISVAQEIVRLCAGEEFAVQMVNPKGDKVARAHAVEHLFANGLIYAPQRSWSDMVIQEMASFPKGKHDDLVDTATGALKWLRDNGIAQLAEERTYEMNRERLPPGQREPLYDV